LAADATVDRGRRRLPLAAIVSGALAPLEVEGRMRMVWWVRSLFVLFLVGISGTLLYAAQELAGPRGSVFVAVVTFIGTVLAFLLGMYAQARLAPSEEELNQPGTWPGRVLTGVLFLAAMLPTLLYLFRADFVPLTRSGGAPVFADDARCTGRWEDLKVCNQDPRWTTGASDERPSTFTLTPDERVSVDGLGGTVRVRHACAADRQRLASVMVTDFRISVDGTQVASGSVDGEGTVSLAADGPVPTTVRTVTLTAGVGEDDATECPRWVTFTKVLQRDAWGFWQ
jgi:hypothetical protein